MSIAQSIRPIRASRCPPTVTAANLSTKNTHMVEPASHLQAYSGSVKRSNSSKFSNFPSVGSESLTNPPSTPQPAHLPSPPSKKPHVPRPGKAPAEGANTPKNDFSHQASRSAQTSAQTFKVPPARPPSLYPSTTPLHQPPQPTLLPPQPPHTTLLTSLKR